MSTATLRDLPAWKALESQFPKVRDRHLRDFFAEDPGRGERLNAEAAGLFLDYSKNRVTDETLKTARPAGRTIRPPRPDRRDVSRRQDQRHRAPLGAPRRALRAPKGQSIVVDGQDVVPEVHAVLDTDGRLRRPDPQRRVEGLHAASAIRNVINIGIGGSDLGPVMAYEALKHYSDRALTFRFVSNVDGTDFAEATRDLDPAETLFIVSSKTFTTLETMTNAHTARAWTLAALKDDEGDRAAFRRRLDECRGGAASSASTRRTCSASGTGSAGVTRWTRPSACRR